MKRTGKDTGYLYSAEWESYEIDALRAEMGIDPDDAIDYREASSWCVAWPSSGDRSIEELLASRFHLPDTFVPQRPSRPSIKRPLTIREIDRRLRVIADKLKTPNPFLLARSIQRESEISAIECARESKRLHASLKVADRRRKEAERWAATVAKRVAKKSINKHVARAASVASKEAARTASVAAKEAAKEAYVATKKAVLAREAARAARKGTRSQAASKTIAPEADRMRVQVAREERRARVALRIEAQRKRQKLVGKAAADR